MGRSADVIALAREGDVAQETTAPFSVSELFDSARDMVRPLAEEKPLDLRFEPPADDARIGNSVALGRVLLNPENLYVPFQRTSYRQVLRFSGTGLGLSICRRTVEALGGELTFESTAGEGTTFCFDLELPKASRY
jgi:signal transduction histidine kinase